MVLHTRNVTRVYRKALEAGTPASSWYPTAHNIVAGMAAEHGTTVEVAAGVLAAVSPQNSWGANVKLADRILAAGGMDSGYFKQGLQRAQRIIDGEHPLDVMKSDKIRNFYLCVYSAGDEGICIDRHAFDLAVNKRYAYVTSNRLTPKQYAEVADKYARAAKIFGVSPATVQAVTWVEWRQRYWARGAFDIKED